MKKRILCSILDTDIAKAKNTNMELQNHLDHRQIKEGSNFFNFIDQTTSDSTENSKQLISSSILHAADISTSVKQFDQSVMWCDLLYQEFYNQGDYEKQ